MFFYFFRESNNFDDIMTDVSIKKHIKTQILCFQYLILGVTDIDDKIQSYIMIKYGEDTISLTEKDYSPIPNIDYLPKRPIK